jgi:redox-sensitive bicupin YhaK (pirin superfamily)
MIKVCPSKRRGYLDHGWLKTYHTFSFGDYHDDEYSNFRKLRVLNEDIVAGGTGFPAHPHRNMEILTYIISGELSHEDSTGATGKLSRGDVQTMTAGAGVVHSEQNLSDSPVHLLQIWILPDKLGHQPAYAQKFFSDDSKANKLCLLASSNGEAESLVLHQDVKVFASIVDSGNSLKYESITNRYQWIQLISGKLQLSEQVTLSSGDGVAISEEKMLNLHAVEKAEFLLFDLV